jgi:hypothetical protein
MAMPEINLPPLAAIEELARYKQWVCWRYEARGDGKPTKVPMDPSTGFGASINRAFNWSTLEHALRTANRREFAGVGFVLTARDPFVGIDLDNCIDEAGALSPLAKELIDLAETYAEISPSGRGIRIFARAEHFDSFNLKGHGIEAYASARYLTVTGNHIASVPASINEAPETLRRIFAIRDEVQGAPVERKIVPFVPRAEIGGPREEAYARSAVANETALLAATTEGGRNHQLNVSAMKLGQLVAGDYLTEAEAVSALLDACQANGLLQDDGQKQCEKTIRSGMKKGMTQPRSLPEQERAEIVFAPRQVITSGNDLIDAETGEVLRTAPKHREPEDETWRNPSGMVRHIAEWIMATSKRPNWPLALGSSIAILAALSSRHLCGPTSALTHLYIAALGETAVGKDRPLKAPLPILRALEGITTAGSFTRIFTTGKFKSETAIEQVITETPARLAKLDEAGQLFGRMGSKRASSHESGMASVLRELWSIEPGGIYQTSSRAGSSSQFVETPCLTIFGAATVKEFYASIAGASIENGLLNRWLLIRADKRAEEQDVEHDPKFPEHLARRLLEIMPPQGPGNLPTGHAAALTMPGAIHATRVPWASDDVNRAYMEFGREVLARVDNDPDAEPFLGRAAEMAIRIATIHAIGRDGRLATVTMEDWLFGRSLSMASASIMINDVRMLMAENQYQADYKLILRLIAEAGHGGIRHSDLYRRIDGRVKASDIKSIVEALTASAQIDAIKHPDDRPTRGPWPARYVVLGYRN